MIWLGDYFESTASQRRGALVLLLLIAIVGISYLLNSRKPAQLKLIFHEQNVAVQSDNIMVDSITIEPDQLFKFNPNIINKEKWIKLGFSEKQSQIILNYRSSIGGFKTKKDFAKCYVVDSIKFHELLPYILFPKIKYGNNTCTALFLLKSDTPIYYLNQKFDNLFYLRTENSYKYYIGKDLSKSILDSICESLDSIEFENASIELLDCFKLKKINYKQSKLAVSINALDLNLTSAKELTSIRGIGAVLSLRIIEYRNSLGGFVSVNQLDEVFGLDDETLQTIKSKVAINDTIPIRKLNINQLTLDSLKSHPYINWNLANAIVQFRIQHGNYDSFEKIKSIHLVNNEIYLKIAPYLTIR